MAGESLSKGTVLSDTMIQDEMKAGNVIISPFNQVCLSNCSYDVTLGEWYYRNIDYTSDDPVYRRGGRQFVFNPWCKGDVELFWGSPMRATRKDCVDTGLEPGTQYIVISPGETILAHTQEFIGGRGNITTMMKARSSIGRSCIAICKCAGWGDIGYTNRWTMEITNLSTRTPIVLPVGARVAQIVFMYSGPTSAPYAGKYQQQEEGKESAEQVIKRLEASWTPQAMLPKLWMDKTIS